MTAPVPELTVLVVCTANICRSPVAEALLRGAFRPASGVRVSSAGVHARAGEPVDARMAALVDAPLEGFTARQLTRDLVRDADLVLTMTRDQRRSVVTAVPSAVRRTFTLLEFAELVGLARDVVPAESGGTTGAERLRALGQAAPRVRSRRPAGRDDDIADPHGRSAKDHARAAELIGAAVRDIAAAVGTPVAVDGRR
ncbi:arsenate reductase/protein-tyrosine-phosphatase family protein [Modestobacter sp. VKM Ac-2985]|uniref:arsenate reductase/protein-tyrosine-phosphatase family protein n=1 Tax=Modestobacter sp. VKM Ac-2985 TaxID=3004139 RepID=UPI0022ABC3EE|nr:hypothetical protein [Modestobacter sp. VKM Ac-2985]MCZ2836441.1 hypothetical protein [Modestobacter sp. VKM Ac-2985]